MRIILILVFNFVVLYMGVASAQTVDLNNIPDDYSFVSRGDDGITTVTFLGHDGDLFKFSQETDDFGGHPDIQQVWVNRSSQTVRVENTTFSQEYTPHDCAPLIGNCDFTALRKEGNEIRAHRTTFLMGDVWVDRLSMLIEGEAFFYSRSCTTVDEFGFWIDYVYEEFDGTTGFGQRISSSIEPAASTPFKELQAMCRDTEGLTS